MARKLAKLLVNKYKIDLAFFFNYLAMKGSKG